ncbi:hypothetical protein OXYTRIMIC_328 [Oxytricha trifallax]|uniref:Uncharacterized protein n=1 Tax=Oxytricha trifallax TaxID=1172189 RepID=A0A073IBS8_9SPIT|nr:hypothetical protein OXYTRIMIC_328 [Oxytricha trifallax]
MKQIAEDSIQFDTSKLSNILNSNKQIISNCLAKKNLATVLNELVKKYFPSLKQVQQPQQEKECHWNHYFNSPGNQKEIDIFNYQVLDELKIVCFSQEFGQSFKLPNDILVGSTQAKIYLGGAEIFKILEVEVYSLS